ncbi:unnamed protein product [Zymoseptoria tritici ST99CH_1A5]|uniref:Tat pathway signal sequence n=4 Tax=Zymoseptoria tritici TaxID=1047171 RepID=A0A1X7RYC6_ZYMT9|nr:unnamed protein product [Zymoseptoria tritici ST99CH_3D7]SMR55223.1 unnamed protein product [Zymoseptoria tritici ST99CH_1E4]SMR57598.1 unnamed protein product [Zymoseptoria tritici ST99CH_3D1]SMY26034.1 unnamed protein product [Zymoseptoria tritici ST99CH_1A5]
MMSMFTDNKQQYSRLDQSAESLEADYTTGHLPKKTSRWKYLFHIIALIATSAITLLVDRQLIRSPCTDSLLFRDGDSPSPFMSSIDRSWHTETFNELNFAHLTESEYTRPATMGDEVAAEVDRYWADLGTYDINILIPEGDAHFYGLSTEYNHSLTGPWEKNTPYAGYPVEIQVNHLLHCLNLLRQGQWYNIDYYRKHGVSFGPSQWNAVENHTIIEAHSAHCVEQLRQYVMCDTDIRVVPYGDLDPNEDGPQPIFGQQKQCRNFDSYWRWFQKNQWNNKPQKQRGHVPPVISFSGLPGTFHE